MPSFWPFYIAIGLLAMSAIAQLTAPFNPMNGVTITFYKKDMGDKTCAQMGEIASAGGHKKWACIRW